MLKAAPYPNTGNVGAIETHRTRRLDLHLQHRCQVPPRSHRATGPAQ